MTGGDFYSNEKSVVMDNGGDFRIELVADGKTTVLKETHRSRGPLPGEPVLERPLRRQDLLARLGGRQGVLIDILESGRRDLRRPGALRADHERAHHGARSQYGRRAG